MRFGIFDHLDDGGVPLGQLFEERLKLIEAYDRVGFYGYHLAEHHATPLGYAPSPASSCPRSRSGPANCASGRWYTCCRFTILCG
jgi:hypothetical protein